MVVNYIKYPGIEIRINSKLQSTLLHYHIPRFLKCITLPMNLLFSQFNTVCAPDHSKKRKSYPTKLWCHCTKNSHTSFSQNFLILHHSKKAEAHQKPYTHTHTKKHHLAAYISQAFIFCNSDTLHFCY